jgi:hypothetical protein
MIEDLLTAWRELTGRSTSWPPPVLEQADSTPAVRGGLDRLRSGSELRYARFFLRGRPMLVSRRERKLFGTLERLGLAARIAPSLFAPRARVFPVFGKYVATDLLSHSCSDQVFSLMFEQVYLVRNMSAGPGDRVLELCSGSGVNCLFAAGRAGHATGVDLSGRALAFGRFNAALNGQSTEVELLEGSLFEPVSGGRFDLVLVNPPFELVPESADWFLHSDGGADGLDVVRGVLAAIDDHLAPRGRLEMITWSPASERGPELVRLFREGLPGYGLQVDLLGEDPLDLALDRFRRSPGYEAWRARLSSRGFDRVQMLFVRARRSRSPGVEIRRPAEEIAACHAISDAWS